MRTRLNWIAPLLAAVLVACVGWWADRQISEALRQELADDLRTTLDADVTSLEIWIANQKRVATVLAEEPRLRYLAVEVLSRAGEMEEDRAALTPLARQLILGDRLQARLNDLGYTVAQLVNTNFEIVLDSGRLRSRIGLEVADDMQPRYADLFASGEAIIVTPFKIRTPEPPGRLRARVGAERPGRPGSLGAGPRPEGGAPGKGPGTPREMTVMQVAAPIKDTNGVTRGALALLINADSEFTRILSVAHSGETGETFAFDAEGVMISRSRFDTQLKELGLIDKGQEVSSALTLHLLDPGGDLTQGFKRNTNAARPLMDMVARAIQGGSGVEVTPFRDYRGVRVIGAWTWLPHFGFGVGTKMDAREAFHTLRMVRGVFVILFLLLVLASVAILLFSYRQIVWRRRLTEAELKARQLGQYKLVEKIGEGGMGIVYKAQHALLRRETALKLLTPDRANASSIERFEHEVRLTCRLMHPNTIQIYDFGHTPEGIFYYAMEYLEGLNLNDLVQRYGPQSEGRVINLLIQICESLGEAHAAGLVHRDIKPANVFVCDRGGVPDMVKVLDFGLVRTFINRPQDGEPEPVVGTPNFMPPEAINDPALTDGRSDLYSLGAVGYFLLSGQYLFDGETMETICNKRLTEMPASPSARLGRPLCHHLEALIMRCLEKDPEDRPQTAHELIGLLAASPCAGDWTVEKRAQWWVAHRQAVQAAVTPEPQQLGSASAVNIQLKDRTP